MSRRPQDVRRLHVRFPAALFELIEAAAAAEHRSLNGQIIAMIEELFERREEDNDNARQRPHRSTRR